MALHGEACAVLSVEEGRHLGRFIIRRFLGRGGMGVVYEAWDTRLERRVALKLLHEDLLAQEDAALRFKQEARRAARIEHAHVVRIYGIEEFDGTSVLEMQYIDGRPLHQVLGRNQLDGAQAARLLYQVLEALAACHAQGVIHCDLKPGNLLVAPGWEVYLSDFGIARALRTSDTITAGMSAHSGPLWGTPHYSPPEAWDETPPTPQWDLYSAGVLIYESLVGERAFRAETPMAIIKHVLQGQVEPLAERRPDLSPELVSLVERLMARDPAERPPSAASALRMLLATPEYAQPADDTQPATPMTPADRAAVEEWKRQITPPPAPREVALEPVSTGAWPSWAAWLAAVAALVLVAGTAGYWLRDELLPQAAHTPVGDFDVPKPKPMEMQLAANAHGAFFTFNDGVHGRELWYYDAPKDEVLLVADINAGPASSDPQRFMARMGGLVFSAASEEYGEELWRAAGGPQGVGMDLVRDILPGPLGCNPRPIGNRGQLFLFYATTLKHGTELWVSNGYENQTALVRDLQQGSGGSLPQDPRILLDDAGAYLCATTGPDVAPTLCRYDYDSNELRTLTAVGGDTLPGGKAGDTLLLMDTRPETGYELFRYVPGAAQTELVLDIWPGTEPGSPDQWHSLGDKVVFTAITPEHGDELWVTDGTPAGTRLLADINPGPEGSEPFTFVEYAGHVFIRAHDESHGYEIWVLDPAKLEVKVAADTWPGPESGRPYNLVAGPNGLYYTSGDGVHGEELWRLWREGDAWQREMVADMAPGEASSGAHRLQWTEQPGVGVFVCDLPGQGDILYRLDAPEDGKPTVRPITQRQAQ